jgi:hypothetical protein
MSPGGNNSIPATLQHFESTGLSRNRNQDGPTGVQAESEGDRRGHAWKNRRMPKNGQGEARRSRTHFSNISLSA